MSLDHGSKNRLMPQHAALFPGSTSFARIARAVCSAGVLPRKELYEAWEVARRARRRFKQGRVVDWACGHALLAHMMLLLGPRAEPSSAHANDDATDAAVAAGRAAGRRAIAFDPKLPPSAQKIRALWPELDVTLTDREPRLEPGDILVSCHACGALTDDVIARAIEARVRVAVLPCCHDFKANDDGGLSGWMDGALAIDATRAARLRSAGYQVWTQSIPVDVTPKNRLLLASPM